MENWRRKLITAMETGSSKAGQESNIKVKKSDIETIGHTKFWDKENNTRFFLDPNTAEMEINQLRNILDLFGASITLKAEGEWEMGCTDIEVVTTLSRTDYDAEIKKMARFSDSSFQEFESNN